MIARSALSPADHPAAGEGERGAALLVVLLFCALLAGLLSVAMQGATSGARAATVFLDEMQADELGRGAADAVAAYIVNGGPAAQRGGAFGLRLDHAELDVSYLSESARADVNTAPADLIAALLAAAGADPSLVEAARASAAARDVKAAPLVQLGAGGAFAAPPGGQPLSLGGPSAARPPRFQQPLEAVAYWHLPADVIARVLPALTIANGTTKVDPVLAGRLVLAALMGGDEARVDDYVTRREQGFATQGSALALLPVPAQAQAGFADVSAVRAQALVTVAHRFKRGYEIVLDPPAFAGGAPKILSWHPVF